jgi:hypothetical protein
MPISVLEDIDAELLRIASDTTEKAQKAGLPFTQELERALEEFVQADIEEEIAMQGEEIPKPKPAAAQAEEEEEDPVVDPEVAETTPVLDEAMLNSVVPPRPTVELTPEEIKAATMEKVGEPLVGERAMRPMIFREEGDTVEPSTDERKQNLLWLENFNWIDEGHGNGNQQRVPWEFGGGLSKNTLFNAQQRNEIVKYSGNLYVGPQHIRKKKEMSDRTKFMMTQTMTPTTQNRQRFIRNGALPAGLGRPIKMYRNNELVPFARRYEKETRLVHPDVVDNVRV